MKYYKYSTSANPPDHPNPTPSANVAKGPRQKPHVAVMMMVMMIRLPKLLSTPPSTTLMLPKTKVKVSNCCQHKHLQKRRKFLTFTGLLIRLSNNITMILSVRSIPCDFVNTLSNFETVPVSFCDYVCILI